MRAGIKVDADDLRRMSVDFEQRMGVIEKDIHRLAGHPFNVGSAKQLGEVLFDRMGLGASGPGPAGAGRKTKTGAYATGADVLEELAAPGHELPRVILGWRQLQKLTRTYTDALLDQVDPETHRVHTSFMMTATSTGRLSSTDPNLQNIPIRTEEGRRIREGFVVGKGFDCLMTADYSQVEMRIMAHLSEDAGLIEAFRSGQDFHSITASRVFGVPAEEVTPGQRAKIKAMNYGLAYGLSAFGLGQQLRIDPSEARELMDEYFQTFGGVRDYLAGVVDEARRTGFTETLWGRRRYLPDLSSDIRQRREMGGAADLAVPLDVSIGTGRSWHDAAH